MDRVKNEDIREECNIQKVSVWVQKRRTEWSAYVLRMDEDRQVRKVHDNNSAGKEDGAVQENDGKTLWNKQVFSLTIRRRRRRFSNLTLKIYLGTFAPNRYCFV